MARKLDAVLGPPVQNLIQTAMRRAHIDLGVGNLSREDVFAQLQAEAIAATKRWRRGRCKLTTFLWPRLNGAAIQLVRSHGRRTRAGNQRPVTHSLQELQAQAGSATVDLDRPEAADLEDVLIDVEASQVDEADALADLALELSRLPSRLRLLLYLLFYEDLPLAQAGDRLGISEDQARHLRDAALVKLRLSLLDGRASPHI